MKIVTNTFNNQLETNTWSSQRNLWITSGPWRHRRIPYFKRADVISKLNSQLTAASCSAHLLFCLKVFLHVWRSAHCERKTPEVRHTTETTSVSDRREALGLYPRKPRGPEPLFLRAKAAQLFFFFFLNPQKWIGALISRNLCEAPTATRWKWKARWVPEFPYLQAVDGEFGRKIKSSHGPVTELRVGGTNTLHITNVYFSFSSSWNGTWTLQFLDVLVCLQRLSSSWHFHHVDLPARTLLVRNSSV